MKKRINLADHLQSISYAVAQIAMRPANVDFDLLNPVPGFTTKVVIEKGHRPEEPIWDSVSFDYGHGLDHCGNRYGGIRALVQMILDHVHNHNVEISNAEKTKIPISHGL
jgi:hypothetical protein